MDQKKEQRSSPRQRVLKEVKLLVGPSSETVIATMRDISITGAKLLLRTEIALPATFSVIYVSDRSMQEVKVVWRRGALVGVSFNRERKSVGIRKISL